MVREDQGTIGCTHLKLAVRRTGQGHGDGKIFAQVLGRKGVSMWQITLDNAASYTANEPDRSAVQQNAFAVSRLIIQVLSPPIDDLAIVYKIMVAFYVSHFMLANRHLDV